MRILLFCLALTASVQAQQYVFRTYRQPQGLNNMNVHAIAFDRMGFLWAATENGVFRFLGSNFERFGQEQGIAEVNIVDIVSDPNGTVWAGTLENLYRWDGLKFVTAGGEDIPISGAKQLAVEDARHLLIVEHHRLFRLEHDASGKMLSYQQVFSPQQMASMPELNEAVSVSITGSPEVGRSVWMGCAGEMISIDEDRIGHGVAVKDGAVKKWGAKQGLLDDQWLDVLRDSKGTLWAAGIKHVQVLQRGTASFIDRSPPGHATESIYGHAPIVEDRQGRVIVPAAEGVARWDGEKWETVGRANSLMHSTHIAGLALDASGDLWMGSIGGGVYAWLGYENWEGWSDSLPSQSVWAIVPSTPDRVYVGTNSGPGWINPHDGSAGSLAPVRGWNYGQLGVLGEAGDGSLWGGSFFGEVLRIDSKARRVSEIAKLPALILNAVELPGEQRIFSTRHGLWMSKGYSPPRRIAAVDAMVGDSASYEEACVSPSGDAWFLVNNRFLRLKGGAWSLPAIDGFSRLHGSLLALSCSPNGELWTTGDQTGTWRIRLNGDRLQAWQLRLPASLSALATMAIYADNRGWLWLGTDQGLVVWNGTQWRHLTQESGMIWNDINQSSIRGAPDGSLWVGTTSGVDHLTHPEGIFDAVPLTVLVTAIQRGNQSYMVGAPIVLPWSAAPLQFHISSPMVRNRNELVFKYRLEGLQTEWIESKNGIAIFSDLPPGKYTFMAVAVNSGIGAYSLTLKVEVRVLPPWWRSFWFYGLCGLGVVLLLVVADRMRERHLRLKSLELERLVGERTRELEMSREQLQIQATHDGLTGMLNRVGVLRALAAEMDRARRENRSLVVALTDLDHFKLINDLHGHLAGDEALRWFAAAVGAATRAYDHAGRYGGEEFLLVLTEVPREAAEQRLAGLHASISDLHVRTREAEFTITCSVGATIIDSSTGFGSIESFLAIADLALYAAKEAGRNCVVFRSASDLDGRDANSAPKLPHARLEK